MDRDRLIVLAGFAVNVFTVAYGVRRGVKLARQRAAGGPADHIVGEKLVPTWLGVLFLAVAIPTVIVAIWGVDGAQALLGR